MFRSLIRIVSLMFLLVVIAASHSVLFAESESNSFNEYSNLADFNIDSEADDHESNLFSIQTIEFDNFSVDQNTLTQNTVNKILYSFNTIRAPPPFYL